MDKKKLRKLIAKTLEEESMWHYCFRAKDVTIISFSPRLFKVSIPWDYYITYGMLKVVEDFCLEHNFDLDMLDIHKEFVDIHIHYIGDFE